MTIKTRRNFSIEFKQEAAGLVLDHSYSVMEAAKATPMTEEQRKIRELEKQIKRV